MRVVKEVPYLLVRFNRIKTSMLGEIRFLEEHGLALINQLELWPFLRTMIYPNQDMENQEGNLFSTSYKLTLLKKIMMQQKFMKRLSLNLMK